MSTTESIIERLRQQYPPFMRIKQYMEATGRGQSTVYDEIKKTPGLAVKIGGSTRIVRDFWLDNLEAVAG